MYSPRVGNQCCDLGKRPLNGGFRLVDATGIEPVTSAV